MAAEVSVELADEELEVRVELEVSEVVGKEVAVAVG